LWKRNGRASKTLPSLPTERQQASWPREVELWWVTRFPPLRSSAAQCVPSTPCRIEQSDESKGGTTTDGRTTAGRRRHRHPQRCVLVFLRMSVLRPPAKQQLFASSSDAGHAEGAEAGVCRHAAAAGGRYAGLSSLPQQTSLDKLVLGGCFSDLAVRIGDRRYYTDRPQTQ
jgi:hypothetical protein